MDNFYKNMNPIHVNLKFTTDIEKEDKLAFLDAVQGTEKSDLSIFCWTQKHHMDWQNISIIDETTTGKADYKKKVSILFYPNRISIKFRTVPEIWLIIIRDGAQSLQTEGFYQPELEDV